MQIVTIHALVSPNGELKLALPQEMAGHKVVITILAPRVSAGWPAEFFEKFSGCLPDFPDVDPEGEYEEREPL